MKFIFLGPPGAGKGTLAAAVSADYGIPHISTGEIFREAIKNQTSLGLQVKNIIDSGSLVSDEITISLVKERLQQDDAQIGFILDGFPRTIPQAEALAQLIAIDSVVNFDIDDGEVVKRLSGRRVCKKCKNNYHVLYMPTKKQDVCDNCEGELYIRDDDKPLAIQHRLDVYREQTEPLINYYRQKNMIQDIDARPSVTEILDVFKKIFNKEAFK